MPALADLAGSLPRLIWRLCCLGLILASAACTTVAPPAPTLSSITMMQTAIVLTAVAPPPAYQGLIALPAIDAHLVDQPAWDATVHIVFDGSATSVASGTPPPSSGTLDVQIFHDELTSARRVVFQVDGTAFGVSAPRKIEAVRIAGDYYLVNQGNCQRVTDAASQQIADLTPTSLLGGIARLETIGAPQTIAGLKAWEYGFPPDAVSVPIVHLVSGGKLTVVAGSAWLAPAANALVQFSLTVEVNNVTLLNAALPVTGHLRESYVMGSIGQLHNITVPFGC